MAQVNVVTTIRPVHSLVAGVMSGVGNPQLLMDGAQSPHSFSLKPSQARMLQEAEIVFWIGPQLEAFMHKSLGSLAPNARSILLIETDGLNQIDAEEHDHGEGHSEEEHDDDDAGIDPHIWLNPDNAGVLLGSIANELGRIDPKNAGAYEANAMEMKQKLQDLTAKIIAELEPVRELEFMVFHEAYRHFEERFAVSNAGALSVNPEVTPGVKRLQILQKRLKSQAIKCVFSEPQFNPNAWSGLSEGVDIRVGVLDPLGLQHVPGPELYFATLLGLTDSLVDCLKR